MLRLHDNASSGNAYKVRLLLAHLGTAVERIEYNTDAGTTRTAEFLRDTNLNGRVPVLQLEDGRCLPESNAILWYLAEGTPYLPGATDEQGRWQRAQVLQWMFFEQYDHEPAVAVARFWLAYSGRPEAFADRLPERQAAGNRALAAMERHLDGREWFVGSGMTLADIVLYAYTHVAGEGGFDLAQYPAIEVWLARVAAQPGHIPLSLQG